MNSLARIASMVFGILMLVLSVAVTIETIVRKLFSISLGGVAELSGYAIAVGAPLAFAIAAIDRAHIRINIFHMRLGLRTRAVLNALAAVTMAGLAGYLFYFTWRTVSETAEYQSIAQTPWATPLIYPQSLWLAVMAIFAVAAIWLGLAALRLLAAGDWDGLDRNFAPQSAEEELKAELDDLKRR